MNSKELLIVTVRHSLTAHNTAGRITGRLDVPLSAEGREAAQRFVRAEGFLSAHIVLSSPARRAVETAMILTGLAEEDIVLDERCHERHYGTLQGLSRDQVAAYAEQITYLEADGVRHSLNPPGGETLPRLRARARSFLQAVQALPTQSILIASHGAFLQQLHGLLLQHSMRLTLARHVHSLQVDQFTVRPGAKSQHRRTHPGLNAEPVW
ncbi:histidine phosphatase family protein [Streptomyces sp. NPDC054871]